MAHVRVTADFRAQRGSLGLVTYLAGEVLDNDLAQWALDNECPVELIVEAEPVKAEPKPRAPRMEPAQKAPVAKKAAAKKAPAAKATKS